MEDGCGVALEEKFLAIGGYWETKQEIFNNLITIQGLRTWTYRWLNTTYCLEVGYNGLNCQMGGIIAHIFV